MLLVRYRDYVQRFGAGKGSERRIRGNKIFHTHILATWAKDIVTHPRLLGAVSAVLGSSNLLIWSSDLTVKPKQSSECFGWHQDEAYADVDGVGGGPDPGMEHLCDNNPDQGPVSSIAEEQQRHCNDSSSFLSVEKYSFFSFSLSVQ